MNITRRVLLAGSSAVAMLPGAAAFAQSISPPSPEELWAVLKEPREYPKMLAGVDALTRVLVLRLIQSKAPGDGNLSRWFEIRQRFNTPAAVAQLGQFPYSSDAAQIIKVAGEEVRPTAARIEKALAEGGLAPGKELEKDMLRGFFLFVQLKAVVDQKAMPAKQAWYCDVYPFSIFCNASG